MTDARIRAAIIEAVNDGDRHDALYYVLRWRHEKIVRLDGAPAQ